MRVTTAEPPGRLWKIDPKTMRARVFLQAPSAPAAGRRFGSPDRVTTAAGLGQLPQAIQIAPANPATGELERQLFVSETKDTLLRATTCEVWVLLRTGSGPCHGRSRRSPMRSTRPRLVILISDETAAKTASSWIWTMPVAASHGRAVATWRWPCPRFRWFNRPGLQAFSRLRPLPT